LFAFYNFIFTFYGGRGESTEHAEKVPVPYPIVSCQIMSDFTLFAVKFIGMPSHTFYHGTIVKKAMLASSGISLLSQPPYFLLFLLSVWLVELLLLLASRGWRVRTTHSKERALLTTYSYVP
jgi:hypothetical protein